MCCYIPLHMLHSAGAVRRCRSCAACGLLYISCTWLPQQQLNQLQEVSNTVLLMACGLAALQAAQEPCMAAQWPVWLGTRRAVAAFASSGQERDALA
jgi:hypothetical protein